MKEFQTKVKKEREREIFLADDNPLLDEELPVATLFPPTKLVAIVKPKRVKSPYLELVLLFFCAIISIGADAFIFSSSLFSEIFGNVNTTFTTIVAVTCIIVHIVPEAFWGFCIYRKAVRLGNYCVVLTSDKIIACGKSGYTECRTVNLEDLIDIKKRRNTVTVVGVNDKITLELNDPDAFVALVQSTYDSL